MVAPLHAEGVRSVPFPLRWVKPYDVHEKRRTVWLHEEVSHFRCQAVGRRGRDAPVQDTAATSVGPG